MQLLSCPELYSLLNDGKCLDICRGKKSSNNFQNTSLLKCRYRPILHLYLISRKCQFSCRYNCKIILVVPAPHLHPNKWSPNLEPPPTSWMLQRLECLSPFNLITWGEAIFNNTSMCSSSCSTLGLHGCWSPWARTTSWLWTCQFDPISTPCSNYTYFEDRLLLRIQRSSGIIFIFEKQDYFYGYELRALSSLACRPKYVSNAVPQSQTHPP
jgi:hypothetical protein